MGRLISFEDVKLVDIWTYTLKAVHWRTEVRFLNHDAELLNRINSSPAWAAGEVQKWGRHNSSQPGFRSWSCPELGYLAGAGAVTLARLRLYLEYLFNNSRKLHGT